jgi:hypothetical protein
MRVFFKMSSVWLFLFVIFTSSVMGQANRSSSLVIQEIDSPAGAASGGANLHTGADGRIYLTWIEKKGEKSHTLRFAVRHKNSWSEPKTVIEAENLLVNWADFPSLLALPDGTLVAQWLVKSSPDGHASDVNLARSTDGGKSWSKPITPHRDGTKTEHGFVSMLAGAGGQAFMVWLDGRNFAGDSHTGDGASSKEMTLRYATMDAKGQSSKETVVDPRVCECCQTSAAMTAEGPIVVYRDRSDKEVRDISFVRLIKERWTEPRTLCADGWEINGCPVNGPSVSADGRRVAVAWFTAVKDTPRVKVIFSTDAGQTFGSPIQVDEGRPAGRVDVEVLGDGSALVTWLENTANGGEIKIRRVRPDGSRDEAKTLSISSAARTSGFPRAARVGNEVIFAWTQPGKPSRVRTAVLNFADGK